MRRAEALTGAALRFAFLSVPDDLATARGKASGALSSKPRARIPSEGTTRLIFRRFISQPIPNSKQEAVELSPHPKNPGEPLVQNFTGVYDDLYYLYPK